MSFDDELREQVYSVSDVEYPTTRAEIIELYQDKYGSSGSAWKDAIFDHFMQLYPDAKRGTIRREFQKATGKNYERWQASNPNKATRERYENLSKHLAEFGIPPRNVKTPARGFSVNIKGTVKISDDRRYRDFDIIFLGDEAYDFANSDLSLESAFEHYGVDGDMFANGLESDTTIDVIPM